MKTWANYYKTKIFMTGSFKIILIHLAMMISFPSIACTSVIVSSNVTLSGKPLMMKIRDTEELNNRIEFFRGHVYNFIGLVNSTSEGGEVWAGTNSAGLSIMNTASYNLKDDDIKKEMMDKEGELMFRALGICATIKDFEYFLDNISKPYGVESNFGVIDASGGAAYYEINNHSWVKFDVNESECGYRVVTNFSESGRKEDYKGYERYLTASSIMEDFHSNVENGKMNIGPHDLFYGLSRSYRHAMTGLDYLNDFSSLKKEYGFTGIISDQDLIPRKSTSASIVFEGARPGEDPLHTVMWAVLGYPCCSVSIPLLVFDEDTIPYFMKSYSLSKNAPMCDYAMKIKDKYIYNEILSNKSSYIDINNIMNLIHSCLRTESMIEENWIDIYENWVNGKTNFEVFKNKYSRFCLEYYNRYTSEFSSFIK